MKSSVPFIPPYSSLWCVWLAFLVACTSSPDGQLRANAVDASTQADMSSMDAEMFDAWSAFTDQGLPSDFSYGQPDQFALDAVMPVIDQGVVVDAMPVADIEPVSVGCGRSPEIGSGSRYVDIDAGPEGDGPRRFLLSIPANYDPNRPHALIVGFAGRDAQGELMQRYLGLERASRPDEIFVYPDPLRRAFEGWGTYGGWLLGPHARPAHGNQDLTFTRTMVEYLEERYCIDPRRIFATGHSWGGDMAHVVACFLGDIFRAVVPVAANRPYWFEMAGGQAVTCEGQTAVWTFFGIADDAFLAAQRYPGEFGDQVRDFWLGENGCDGVEEHMSIDLDPTGDCSSYRGCDPDVRYCLYGPATGHQIPPYYPNVTMEWFRSF